MNPEEFSEFADRMDRRMGEMDRRHENLVYLAQVVHEQNAKIGELSGLIKGMADAQRQMHEDQRADVDSLHNKINDHVVDCPMINRVTRLESIESRRATLLGAVAALAGVIGTTVAIAFKPLIEKLWERWINS